MTESEFHFHVKMHILWRYFATRGSCSVDFVALFLLFDLVWSEQLTLYQLNGMAALIYGSPYLDIVEKWIEEGVLERVMDGESEAVRLAIFPPGSEELIDLLLEEETGMYVKVMSDAKAAIGGSPSMKDVLREAIANWKWLQRQESEVGRDSAGHDESTSGSDDHEKKA